jgi:hypothetical protein
MASKRRASQVSDTTRVAIEPLVTSVIDLFIEGVDSSVSNAPVSEMRASTAGALMKFDQLCKTTRQLVRERAQLPYYRFYYYSMLTTQTSPMRFLDKTFGVTLFTGCFGDGPSEPAKFDVMNVRDALHDRTKIARKLVGMDNVAVKRCKRYVPRDLPVAVSARVAAFVGRARMVAQRLAARHPALCVPCARGGCGRSLLYDRSMPPIGNEDAPIVQDMDSDDTSGTDKEEEDDVDMGSEYWQMLTTRPPAKLPPRVFCSRACACAYDDEVAQAVPVRLCDLETNYHCSEGKTGLSRVAIEARRCFARNAAVARALRVAMRSFERRRCSTLSKDTVERFHRDVTDTLNVDLALVYAAAAIAESPAACVARRLPATSPAWREDAKAWRLAVRAIQQVYERSWRPSDGLACDDRLPAGWLRQVRNRACVLFPTSSLE